MDLIRQLEFEHKKWWDERKKPNPEMVADSDCDPVLLSGWTNRDISLWDVSAADGKPNIEEILFALCRNRNDWKKISYLRFSNKIVSSAGLKLTSTTGNTGDQKIDLSRTHYEIKGITGKSLCTLLFQISNDNNFDTGVFTKKEYEKILLETYDKYQKRLVIQGNASQISDMGLPPSSTIEKDTTIGQTSIETQTTDSKLSADSDTSLE